MNEVTLYRDGAFSVGPLSRNLAAPGSGRGLCIFRVKVVETFKLFQFRSVALGPFPLQGNLAHKKPTPPMTLQKAYA